MQLRTRQPERPRPRLAVRTAVLLLVVAAVGPKAGGQPRLTRLVAQDAAADDRLGGAVAIDGQVAIVGAIGADDACFDDPSCDSGAAYLFDTRTGRQLHKLVSEDATILDSFGISVAIDQDRAIVGALADGLAGAVTGAAYIFDVPAGQQLRKLTAGDASSLDFFGRSVGIYGDRAIVGAILDEDAGPGSGSAYLFDVTSGEQLLKLTADDAARGDWFGMSVAIDADTAIIGAPEPSAPFTPPGTGSAYLFDLDTGRQRAKLVADDGEVADQFGAAVAIDGNWAIVGSPRHNDDAGAAYIFDVVTGRQLRKLALPDGIFGDQFGFSVGIDGNLAVVGAPEPATTFTPAGAGSAYVFDIQTGQQRSRISPSEGKENDQFGYSIAIDGQVAVVGARFSDDVAADAGSAWAVAPVVPEPSGARLFIVGLLVLTMARARNK